MFHKTARHTIVQSFGRHILIVNALIQFQCNLFLLCDGQSGNDAGFTSVSLANYYFTILHIRHSMLVD